MDAISTILEQAVKPAPPSVGERLDELAALPSPADRIVDTRHEVVGAERCC